MAKQWSVVEVRDLFTSKVGDNFASTTEGKKHLNRIAKAITDESLQMRVLSLRETNAQKAFDKKYRELSSSDPEKADALSAREEAWKATWIDRKYGKDDDF
jgi:hypothetical protein